MTGSAMTFVAPSPGSVPAIVQFTLTLSGASLFRRVRRQDSEFASKGPRLSGLCFLVRFPNGDIDRSHWTEAGERPVEVGGLAHHQDGQLFPVDVGLCCRRDFFNGHASDTGQITLQEVRRVAVELVVDPFTEDLLL